MIGRVSKWTPPFAALAFVLLIGPAAQGQQVGLAPGTPAPDFALQTVQGETLSLSALRGNIVLLTFFTPT